MMLHMSVWVTLLLLMHSLNSQVFPHSGTGWQLSSTTKTDFLASISHYVDVTMAELGIPIPSLLPWLWEQAYCFHLTKTTSICFCPAALLYFWILVEFIKWATIFLHPMCRPCYVLSIHCWIMSACEQQLPVSVQVHADGYCTVCVGAEWWPAWEWQSCKCIWINLSLKYCLKCKRVLHSLWINTWRCTKW